MKSVIGTSGVALWATLTCTALGAQGPNAPKRAAGPLCDASPNICALPLSYEDSVLDDSTDSYLIAAAREISKAAAIEMAVELRGIYRGCREGHFAQAYEANAAAIESLATKPAKEHASSAEIRSLKSLRAALYADTVLGLEAAAARSTSQEFRAVYSGRKAVLDGVINSMASPQPMRAAERQAVCDVLAAYENHANAATASFAGTPERVDRSEAVARER